MNKNHPLAWVKIVIVLGIWWAVFQSWPVSLHQISIPEFSFSTWTYLIFLGTLNWVVEWIKWHRLVSPITPASRKTRWKEINRGFLLGQGLPLGDWVGRMVEWSRKDRKVGWALNAYASSWQTVVSVGGALLTGHLFFPHWPWAVLWTLFFLYFLLHFLTNHLSWNGFTFPKLRQWETGFWSALRHVILTLQAVILTHYFGLSLSPWEIIAAWQWIWLMKMLGGLLNSWGELGTRQWSGVYFLGCIGLPAWEATLLIWVLWFLNNSIPFLLGSIYWLRTWKSSTSLQ